MIKLIVLLVGIAAGFGGGVYWAHKNPDQAATLSAEEEKRFLEAQLAITEKIKAKLEQLSTNMSVKPSGASGFVSSAQSGAATASDVKDLKSDAQRQEDELRKRLDTLKK
jgi:hypothetical protein